VWPRRGSAAIDHRTGSVRPDRSTFLARLDPAGHALGPRSSVEKSSGFLNRVSEVRFLPGAPALHAETPSPAIRGGRCCGQVVASYPKS
jgi:hypothetical protein